VHGVAFPITVSKGAVERLMSMPALEKSVLS
jgi:hypothetical protein